MIKDAYVQCQSRKAAKDLFDAMELLPGRVKKVYEKDVQLLKLAEPYQMRQLISIVYSHHRERDADLLALAAEGRMYARSLNR